MKLHCFSASFAIASAMILFAADQAGAADSGPRHLLIVAQSSDGHPPTTHEFKAGANVLAELLKPFNSVQCNVVNADEPWPDGPAQIDKSDGVVMLVTQGAQWMQIDSKRHAALQ